MVVTCTNYVRSFVSYFSYQGKVHPDGDEFAGITRAGVIARLSIRRREKYHYCTNHSYFLVYMLDDSATLTPHLATEIPLATQAFDLAAFTFGLQPPLDCCSRRSGLDAWACRPAGLLDQAN
jgi:hypothetical protein